MRKPPKDTGDIIALGASVRLVRTSMIADELGMTDRQCCNTLHKMDVPIQYLGQHSYVNLFIFEAAMHAMSRWGNVDFVAPGSRRRNTMHAKARRDQADSLKPGVTSDMVKASLSEILGEMDLAALIYGAANRRLLEARAHALGKQLLKTVNQHRHDVKLYGGPKKWKKDRHGRISQRKIVTGMDTIRARQIMEDEPLMSTKKPQ